MRPKGIARKYRERQTGVTHSANKEPKAISSETGKVRRRNRHLTLEERQDIEARYMAG